MWGVDPTKSHPAYPLVAPGNLYSTLVSGQTSFLVYPHLSSIGANGAHGDSDYLRFGFGLGKPDHLQRIFVLDTVEKRLSLHAIKMVKAPSES